MRVTGCSSRESKNRSGTATWTLYAIWSRRLKPHLRGPEQVAWFNRLETEYDNMRAALEWSLEDGNVAANASANAGANARAEVGLRLAAAEHWFWFLRDRRNEGSMWFDRVLAEILPPLHLTKANRAKVLCGAGFLATWRRDLEHATALSEESLALFRELGDERGIGWALTIWLGWGIIREELRPGEKAGGGKRSAAPKS